MKKQTVKKARGEPRSQAPFRRRNESEMILIAREIQSGFISKRAACFKYGLNRQTLKKWLMRLSVSNLADGFSQQLLSAMTEEQQIIALQKKIRELTRALEAANLKIDGLETMIRIAEKDLNVKIRKKSGTKQSRE